MRCGSTGTRQITVELTESGSGWCMGGVRYHIDACVQFSMHGEVKMRGDKGVMLSGEYEGATLGEGPARSTSTEELLFRSIATVLGSIGVSIPPTPGRSSYKMGENLTATLGFLCPGNRAIGGRAKLARE